MSAACSRTGLDAYGSGEAGWETDADIDASDIPSSRPEASSDAAPRGPPSEASTGTSCEPVAEECNGADDDCNGRVDDGLAPVPCPLGGFRYCVAGRWSACPQRCEVCLPGSQRVCLLSYCLYWGVQTCAADGKGFGPCREQRPPSACAEIARTHKDSPELERCCIDQGYCCLDGHDLDGDGDRAEVLGRCSEVLCPE